MDLPIDLRPFPMSSPIHMKNEYNRMETQNLFSSYHSMISTEPTSVTVSPTESFTSSTINDGVSDKAGILHPNFAATLSISLQPKSLVILVGLPASGKSTICKQLVSYINENGCFGKIYNSGKVRRLVHLTAFDDSNYFDPSNKQAKVQRDIFAVSSLDTILHDLKNNKITCGFLDATNTTLARRQLVMERVSQFEKEYSFTIDNVVIFDVRTDDPDIINFNINGKAYNSDYKDKDYDFAIRDFKERTDHYRAAYNEVTPSELELYGGKVNAYVMIKNAGESYEIRSYATHVATVEPEVDTVELIKQFIRAYRENQGKRYIEALARYYGTPGKFEP